MNFFSVSRIQGPLIIMLNHVLICRNYDADSCQIRKTPLSNSGSAEDAQLGPFGRFLRWFSCGWSNSRILICLPYVSTYLPPENLYHFLPIHLPTSLPPKKKNAAKSRVGRQWSARYDPPWRCTTCGTVTCRPLVLSLEDLLKSKCSFKCVLKNSWPVTSQHPVILQCFGGLPTKDVQNHGELILGWGPMMKALIVGFPQ